MWPFRKKLQSRKSPTNPNVLVGHWRFEREVGGSQCMGDHAMEFFSSGDLVYSTLESNIVTGRMLLTYRIDGGNLITDQPSAPREEVTPFSVEGSKLVIGDPTSCVVLVRDVEGKRVDPLAPLFGIGASAVNHGLGSAHPDGPFAPFLMLHSASNRKLVRLVTDSPDQARDAALDRVRKKRTEITAVAYAYDGFVTLESGRFDCVFVEVSHLMVPDALLLAQPYLFEGNMAVRGGQMVNQPLESWL